MDAKDALQIIQEMLSTFDARDTSETRSIELLGEIENVIDGIDTRVEAQTRP